MHPDAPALPASNPALRLRAISRRRRRRGVTLVEYIALLTLVVLPSTAAAIKCFVSVSAWYSSFVRDVSQSTP